jgi:hypothetical protein
LGSEIKRISGGPKGPAAFVYHLSLSISITNRAIGIQSPIARKEKKTPRPVEISIMYEFIQYILKNSCSYILKKIM